MKQGALGCDHLRTYDINIFSLVFGFASELLSAFVSGEALATIWYDLLGWLDTVLAIASAPVKLSIVVGVHSDG